jgi:ArsR family transcriptional regulator
MKRETDNQEKTEEQAALFKALADPTRLKLVKLLCRQRVREALCVTAMARPLGITQSAVSQHLRILKNVGLVKGERRGYHVHYSIDREALERARSLLSLVLAAEVPD